MPVGSRWRSYFWSVVASRISTLLVGSLTGQWRLLYGRASIELMQTRTVSFYPTLHGGFVLVGPLQRSLGSFPVTRSQ